MSFLAPFLLAGLIATAIPPIIHLIHRRKAVVVRFPALEFILRANKKTSRRFKARQLLLMILRMCLLAALAFALSRPFLRGAQTQAADLAGVQGQVVIVIDASYPMTYSLDRVSLLDRARQQANELLDELSGQAALVIAGDRIVAPLSAPTSDTASVRDALDDIEPGFGTSTLNEGVARAYDILGGEATPGDRRVVVLTTPAGAAGSLPPPPQDGPKIELVPVSAAGVAPVPNRAITGVDLRPAPEMGAGHWRVDVTVANYAADPVERLPVHIAVEDRVLVRGFLSLEAGESGVKTFYTRLPGDAATPASAVIEGDALTLDDTRAFWLQPAPRIRVLAVNGDPQPTPYLDELFYLENALAPNTTAGARVKLTITGLDTLDRYTMDEYDVVVWANVPAPTADQARNLEAFVRGGGGLLVTVGGQIDRDLTNVRMAQLLPRTLRDERQAGDAAATAEGGDRRAASLGAFDRSHSILRPFPDPAGTSLGSVKVRRYMLLDPAPDAGGEVVIGVEGAPYLITRSVDQGRVALLTSSLDRDWGDLPIRPDFVPLIQQTLRFLTRVAELEAAPVMVGRPAPVPVDDPRVLRVQVRTPSGELHVVERPSRAGDPWQFTETRRPGHYQITPDPPLPGLVALPGFAVAVDATAGDLQGQPPETQADDKDPVRSVLAGNKRTELWHAALVGLFVLLLLEGVVLIRRRDVEVADVE